MTVVIPTYQRRDQLERALTSLCQPGSDRIAVVISDNCSQDGTEEYCRHLEMPFPVNYLRNPTNIGICKNFFQASKAVQTPYEFWLTDDDYLMPGGLQKVLETIEANPDCAYIFSHLHSLHENGSPEDEPLYIHGPSTESFRIESGVDAVSQHARYGWGYSRQVLKSECIDWKFWERNLFNSYIPILVSGRIMLEFPAYYHAESVVGHTVENVRHFEEFGSDQLEIELRTQADYRNAMKAIFDDQPKTREVRAVISRWERGCEELCLGLLREQLSQMSLSEASQLLIDRYGVNKPAALRMVLKSRSKLLRKLHRHHDKRLMRDTVKVRDLKQVAA